MFKKTKNVNPTFNFLKIFNNNVYDATNLMTQAQESY